ncbi:hypothetical protein [Variovorax sp. ZT4R33]|uniref:hypothetical protein n=1 Tax=Variovorax sp. ZT4R33 TaxID=3443743 RepID=UPI003F48DA87
MNTPAASFIVTGIPSGPAYGSLFDLARLQRGADAEICESCNTINIGHARWCKSCARRLPGMAREVDAEALTRSTEAPKPAIAPEFYAFWAVINSLVLVTTFVPFG